MNIRRKITIRFILIVVLINIVSSLAIYFSFAESRQEEFYDRLSQKARLIAQMLIDIDEIDTGLLHKIEKNNPLSLPNEVIHIYDYNNQLIYTSAGADFSPIPTELINEVRLNDEVRFRNGKTESVGHFYTGKYDRIVVFVAATDIFGINKLMRLRIILLFVFILSLVIVFFSGRIFANRALDPITRLIREINSIETGYLNVRLNTGDNEDEIATLAIAINHFLARLENAVNMQKNFIANASHELRTPLTVLSGHLEVLLRKERTREEYRQTLQTLLEAINDLSAISNKLLLLARASSEISNISFTDCRIDDIIWQAQAELKRRQPDYHIQVNLSDDFDAADKLTVRGNDALLRSAFLNLMENACKYSGDQTCIISLLNSDRSEIICRFEDRGIGIRKEDVPHLFEPFFRAGEVMNKKGHGIGLSLAQKVMTMHNGSIRVESEYGEGSAFIIALPLKDKTG